ncbi:2-oxoacid:acceptor oxidoreductase family protein [Seleniivibrio woodruffii]|uniref:2-oxoacid:acceptor oxidoreductase family protein n=1 Tax=Seleniivibrio woodruffii TaxID=1078050 RepID=UPI0024097136|nr:2-oxoacid:acceptor oxidoreductase family protein [Seleniivibrio woodruffii]
MIQGIICGKGGQGVITLNAMIGTLAANMNIPAVSAETHGMAMRGGSVATYIKIGQGLSASVAEHSADFIISLTKDEALRNLNFIKKDGILIVDSEKPLDIKGIRVIALPASDIAEEKFGGRIYGGQVLLGIFLGCFGAIDTAKALEILRNAPKISIEAIEYGVKHAQAD